MELSIMKAKAINELITELPSGSVPRVITKESLFKLDTIQNNEGSDYISHRQLFEHVSERLDRKSGISFKPELIEVSNKIVLNMDGGVDNDLPFLMEESDNKRVSVRKAMVKFVSDVLFDNNGKAMTLMYSAKYSEQAFELCYAMGFDVRICANGNIIGADHVIKKSGRSMHPREMDVYLDSWVHNYEEHIVKFSDFSERLEGKTFKAKECDKFLGKMIQDIITNPAKITDINVFTQAVKLLNSPKKNLFPRNEDGSVTAWNVYNHFTDALKGEEISSRFKKHGNISKYFEQNAVLVG